MNPLTMYLEPISFWMILNEFNLLNVLFSEISYGYPYKYYGYLLAKGQERGGPQLIF